MESVLSQLRKMTKVVADSGDIRSIQAYAPVDCTTNPSLVLAAFKDDASEEIVRTEIEAGRKEGKDAFEITSSLTVALGARLASLVPGRVSTEVDANLSFDADASVKRALQIVDNYKERGVDLDRILIKLASTWEGIRAAEILQGRGIDCNLTLMFSMVQAVASANAQAFLISPFVGRITDWYKQKHGVDAYQVHDDPGVKSVKEIYDYYKANGVETIVMGASFRNSDQIKALAGCDNLTIAPKLLDKLENEVHKLERALVPDQEACRELAVLSEQELRWQMNEDPMATEKLAEGIRQFDSDHRALVNLVAKKMNAC